jgi:hypothetical protein
MGTPVELAGQAAESVRALNHATYGGAGYDTAAEVYSSVGALAELLRILPQAFDQAAGAIDRANVAGRLSMDSTAPVGLGAATVAEKLRWLRRDAAPLQKFLGQAHEDLSHLAGWLTGPAGDDGGEVW